MRSRRLRPAALVLAAALVLVGCGRQNATAPPPAAATAADIPVALNEVTVRGLEAAVREQKGKVVLIDAWFYG